MKHDGSGVVWSLWLVVSITMVCIPVGCGSSSDTEETDPEPEPDTGQPTPEISISKECETACENFMDKCGKMVPATRSDCEFDCERNWTVQVTNCVSEAAVCAEIEACDGDGGAAVDTGASRDGGEAGYDAGDGADIADRDTGRVDGGGTDADEAIDAADGR